MTITITALKVKNSPRRSGTTVVADFDFITPNIGMKGCSLVKTPNGAWRVWTPTLDIDAARARREQRVAIYFRAEGSLREEVTNAAVSALHRLGFNT